MIKLLAALALVSACSSHREANHEVPSTPKEKPMEANATVFDLIPRLVNKLPFQHQDVATLIGVTLTRDDKTSTNAYDIYRSTAGKGAIASVEVRQPTNAPAGKNGIVILELAAEPCFKSKDAIARFGDPSDLGVPTPHQPADSPEYYIFKQKWGVLRLGFARSGNECMTTVVLDAT